MPSPPSRPRKPIRLGQDFLGQIGYKDRPGLLQAQGTGESAMKSVERLVAEHDLIERGLNLLDKAVARLDAGQPRNGSMMVWFSGLHKKSDEAGFIVVYPSGT